MKSEENQSRIQFFSPHWGYENIPVDEFIPRIKKAGYDGLEVNIVSWKDMDVKALLELAAGHDLKLITQVAGIVENHFSAYKKRFVENLEYQMGLAPVFIICHTGSDFFSFEQNCKLIEAAETISTSHGIKVLHETHRGRFSYSPAEITKYLKEFPDLRLVADFSHWCVVSESLLENHTPALQLAIERSDHIHSRVGHAQSPQVSDPRLPEWKEELDIHLKWWDDIVSVHRSRDSYPSFTTEFGPPDYMPVNPYTKTPMADQWEINLHMKELLRERYSDRS
jgi:sugar phosphate isomerase/epimerase